MKKPSIKHYADYFVMGLQLGISLHSEIIAWADRIIETTNRPTDWAIDLSTSSQKSKLDVIHVLNSIPGVSDLEVSFRLLIAKLALVKPVIFPDNGFINPQDSWLFSQLYFMTTEHNNLSDCIRENIFQIYIDMDCVDRGYGDFSIIQQDYKNLLIVGKEYSTLHNKQ